MTVHQLPPWRQCGSTNHTHQRVAASEHPLLDTESCGCSVPHVYYATQEQVDAALEAMGIDEDCPDC